MYAAVGILAIGSLCEPSSVHNVHVPSEFFWAQVPVLACVEASGTDSSWCSPYSGYPVPASALPLPGVWGYPALPGLNS